MTAGVREVGAGRWGGGRTLGPVPAMPLRCWSQGGQDLGVPFVNVGEKKKENNKEYGHWKQG